MGTYGQRAGRGHGGLAARAADRAEELRRTYETRYQALRQRLLACLLLGCAVLAAAGLLVVSAAA
ncbi:hypothetical protein ACWCQS_04395 [Streptomyces sp. NPDC002076]